jgi:hypothetical protein
MMTMTLDSCGATGRVVDDAPGLVEAVGPVDVLVTPVGADAAEPGETGGRAGVEGCEQAPRTASASAQNTGRRLRRRTARRLASSEPRGRLRPMLSEPRCLRATGRSRAALTWR